MSDLVVGQTVKQEGVTVSGGGDVTEEAQIVLPSAKMRVTMKNKGPTSVKKIPFFANSRVSTSREFQSPRVGGVSHLRIYNKQHDELSRVDAEQLEKSPTNANVANRANRIEYGGQSNTSQDSGKPTSLPPARKPNTGLSSIQKRSTTRGVDHDGASAALISESDQFEMPRNPKLHMREMVNNLTI